MCLNICSKLIRPLSCIRIWHTLHFCCCMNFWKSHQVWNTRPKLHKYIDLWISYWVGVTSLVCMNFNHEVQRICNKTVTEFRRRLEVFSCHYNTYLWTALYLFLSTVVSIVDGHWTLGECCLLKCNISAKVVFLITRKKKVEQHKFPSHSGSRPLEFSCICQKFKRKQLFLWMYIRKRFGSSHWYVYIPCHSSLSHDSCHLS